ncbi:Imm1 family immunity protein [Amycolatopsis rubida]|uniref:Immunity protein Imm1 n=1 Tax=Amycolatopsis rubida TaxID=112413 RepID=A0A1I6B3E0_9PSEU|nr:Imm1 family immunity protein [Amycolatopsis rubida]SFQ75471.1 Immunity protein Imm1 [Amycolatopsis rubida]
MILTAALATGIAVAAEGKNAAAALVDQILDIDHTEQESVLCVGEQEFYTSKKNGPFPNHQFLVSVSTVYALAALTYRDHDDPVMPIANSYNSERPLPELDLICDGETGAVFPRTALIPVSLARMGLLEWLDTWKRPACIEWRPCKV